MLANLANLAILANVTKCAAFLTNFFRGVFGRARRYRDWLCCVALRFVVCFVLRCFVM